MPATLFEEHLSTASAHLRQVDAIMAALIERLPKPGRQARNDRFGSLLSAIVSQQLSGKAASTIMGRVLALFPDGVSAERLLTVDGDSLRAAGLSGAKSRYVVDLAARVVGGSLDLQTIDRLSDEEVIQTLTQVKGIGRWTAEMFLIFSLERPNILPVDDLGVRAALKRHYNLASLPDKATCEAIASAWHPYRSIATLYLWHSLE